VHLRGVAKFCMHAPNYCEVGAYNVTESDFQTIKDLLNPDVIRIDLCFINLFPDEDPPYNPSERYVRLLDDIVRWCGERKMYVILDMHSYLPYMKQVPDFFSDARYAERVRRAWGYLAARYGQNPVVCGADLFNEPWNLTSKDEPDPATWKRMAESWIDAILPHAPHWLFFVEGVDRIRWGHDNFNWIKTHGIQRPNVVYSPHLYWGRPGQWKKPWARLYAEGKRQEGRAAMRAWIEERWPLDEPNPWFVGEFGAYPDDVSLAILEDVLELFHERGIHYTYWAWVGRPQPSLCLVDEQTWSVLTPQGDILRRFLAR